MTNDRRFPKKYRFTVVNRLQNLVIDIFQHIQEANELDLSDPQEFRERRYEQKKALTKWGTNENLATYIEPGPLVISLTPEEAEEIAAKLNAEPGTITPGP